MPIPKQTPPQPIKALPHRTNIWLLLIPIIFIAVLFILYVFVWEESIRDRQINNIRHQSKIALNKLALDSQDKIRELQTEINKLEKSEGETTNSSDNWPIYFNEAFPFIFKYPPAFEVSHEDVSANDNEVSVTFKNNESAQIIVLVEKSFFESLEDLQKFTQKDLGSEEATENGVKILVDNMVNINNTKYYHSAISYMSSTVHSNHSTIDDDMMTMLIYDLKTDQDNTKKLELIDNEIQEIIKTMVINDGNL